jgi:hypothetical protein
MPIPIYEVYVGESLPDMGLFLRENGALVTGLGSGHTFELKIATLENEVLVTKTTGIIGQTGSSFPPLGTPNVVIQWATTEDLHELTADETYRAQLKVTRTVDSRVRIQQWLIRARAAL